MAANLMDLDNMRMLKGGDRLRLAEKAVHFRGTGVAAGEDHLQGHQAIELQMAGLVHHAHAAATEEFQDLIAGDLRQSRVCDNRFAGWLCCGPRYIESYGRL